MNDPTVISIDLGTQSIRASAYDTRGNLLAHESRPVVSVGSRGEREQDPHRWTEFIKDALKSFQRQPGLGAKAIGVTGTSNGCIPIDSRGRVLHNALTHYDSRAGNEAAAIVRANSYERLSRKHHLLISAASTLSKILWFKENRSDVYENTELFLDPTAFLFYMLTDLEIMDYFNVQRCFYDVASGGLERELYDEIGIDRNKIPSLGNKSDIITSRGSSKIPGLDLDFDIIVSAASFDNQCALYGVNQLAPGAVHENSGSGVSLRTISEKPVSADGISCVRPRDEQSGYYIVSSYIRSTGLWLRDWLSSHGVTHEDFSRETERGFAAPNLSSKVLLPIGRSGEIFIFDANEKMILQELPFSPESCRAVFEGIVFETRRIHEQIESSLGSLDLVTSGGFGKDGVLTGLKAALLDRAIGISEDPEATSRGAAVAAAFGAKLFPSLREAAERMSSSIRRVAPSIPAEPLFGGYQRYLELRDLCH